MSSLHFSKVILITSLFSSTLSFSKPPVAPSKSEESHRNDLAQADLSSLQNIIKGFEQGLKDRKAEKVCENLADDVLFVNQQGNMFVGKEATLKRHQSILAPGGSLASKPAAHYEVIRMLGSSTEGHARALVHWKYPTSDASCSTLAFSESDPQEGFFIFNFVKTKQRWTIVTLQNTPTPSQPSKALDSDNATCKIK